ncbi:MAG: IMP dehydrogenase, partial [Melioribacteraceae bacterium]|nr:IMP dehydrogenase [Melioribacteraceae bacterium]
MKIYSKKDLNEYSLSLTYDDISLVPKEISQVKSRTEVNIKSSFLGFDLTVPVLASPMDTVCGVEMARELNSLGCIGIVNRFDSSLKELFKDEKSSEGIQAVSIGLTAEDELLEKIAEKKFIVCIDTANANNAHVLKKCEEVKKKYDLKVIIGNIAHGKTLKQLTDAGADAVRIGIGGGSMCTTSIQTGIGIGQVSSLLDVYFH